MIESAAKGTYNSRRSAVYICKKTPLPIVLNEVREKSRRLMSRQQRRVLQGTSHPGGCVEISCGQRPPVSPFRFSIEK